MIEAEASALGGPSSPTRTLPGPDPASPSLQGDAASAALHQPPLAPRPGVPPLHPMAIQSLTPVGLSPPQQQQNDQTAAAAPPTPQLLTSRGQGSRQRQETPPFAFPLTPGSAPNSVPNTPVPPLPHQLALSATAQANARTPQMQHPSPIQLVAASLSHCGAASPHSSPQHGIHGSLSPPSAAGVLGCPNLPLLEQVSSGGGSGTSAGASVPSLQLQGSGSTDADSAILLGVEALERQQAELERKRIEAARFVTAQEEAKKMARDQALERQRQQLEELQTQAQKDREAEARQMSEQQSLSFLGRNPPPRDPAHPGAEDQDDNTEPSSSLGGGNNGGSAPVSTSNLEGSHLMTRRTSSFGRFLKTPLKLRHSSSNNNSHQGDGDDPAVFNRIGAEGKNALFFPPKDVDGLIEVAGMWDDDEVKPLVYGYLKKLGRNGKWQKRWFETDGMHLTYYKSRKRIKLLASLDMCHVGEIQVNNTDPAGCAFTIQVADRPYFLRTSTDAMCKHWVISLNRVKEARIQVGGFQLVEPRFAHGKEGASRGEVSATDRERTESDEVAPRVVMVANRSRTRALALSETEDTMHDLLHQQLWNEASKSPVSQTTPPVQQVLSQDGVSASLPSGYGGSVPPSSPSRITHLPNTVLAKWQKRRSNLQQLSMRLLHWARSMKMVKCIQSQNDTMVGSPVHPPGRAVNDQYKENIGFPATLTHTGIAREGTTESADSSVRAPSVPLPVATSRSFEGAPRIATWIDKESQNQLQSYGQAQSIDLDDNGVESGDAHDIEVQTAPSGGSGKASSGVMVGGSDEYDSDSSEAREIS